MGGPASGEDLFLLVGQPFVEGHRHLKQLVVDHRGRVDQRGGVANIADVLGRVLRLIVEFESSGSVGRTHRDLQDGLPHIVMGKRTVARKQAAVVEAEPGGPGLVAANG